MKISDREKWLVLVLPTVLVVVCYAWWFRLAMSPVVAKLRQDHGTAVAGQLSPQAVGDQRRAAQGPRREIEGLRDKKMALDLQASELCGQWASPERQLEANRELMALFVRNDLGLVEEAPAQGDAATKLPRSLAAALRRVGWSPQAGAGQVRTFKLSGRFPQVLKAIEELTDRQPCLAIPIGLSMAQADPSVEERQWTLTVWM